MFAPRFAPAALIAVAAVWVSPLAAPAQERTFVTVFGSQRPALNNPDFSHSFALFVRLRGGGPAETVGISWLPATLDIHARRLRPEPGVNLPIPDTLDLATRTGQEISQWGPYECRPELFGLAQRFAAKLAGGSVQYRALDLLPKDTEVCNCIYAVVQAIGQNDSLGVTTLGFGEKASRLIARRLEPWLIDRDKDHPWLNPRLGLDRYPITRRRVLFWGWAGERHARRPGSVYPSAFPP